MVRPLMTDTVFLAQKALPADADDIAVADDLLDTLKAHADGCVGMAANMIGVNKAIIEIKKLDIEIIDENLLIYALADIKYFKYINKEISIDNYSKVFKINMPLLKSKYEGDADIELDYFDIADKENALLEIDSIRKKSEESTYTNLKELLEKREKLKSKNYVSDLLSQISDGKGDAMELLKLIKKHRDNE